MIDIITSVLPRPEEFLKKKIFDRMYRHRQHIFTIKFLLSTRWPEVLLLNKGGK